MRENFHPSIDTPKSNLNIYFLEVASYKYEMRIAVSYSIKEELISLIC